ncbi:hypothetical protein [Streptomyces sp. NPDC085665]|uniref:hypothetical protein n=1 Tax=Streptomyces sp. NPDC085665 TaxID=3365735 RepID=UPI0037CE7ED9
MIHFKVAAEGPDPLSVWFEPLAWEVVLDPGDHLLVAWPHYSPGPQLAPVFRHKPGCLSILEPNWTPGSEPGYARVWNSAGEEITY